MATKRPRGRWIARALAGLAVLMVSLTLWTAGPAAQTPPTPQPPRAQDEFVPVDQLPPEQKLPAAQFLIVAYAIVWLGVTGYVWSLWRRLQRVEQELARVVKQP